ncbi:MAG: TolB family protein [Vicinamibacterales bacterium]
MSESRREGAPSDPRPSGGDRLDSWKAIAAYLKRDVRTAQRWERQEALPVHRHLHATQGSVYAYGAELDAWWSGRRMRLEQDAAAAGPLPKGRSKTAAFAVAAALVLLSVGLLFLAVSDPGERPAAEPVRFSVAAPEGTRLSRFPSPAVSPDGRRLVFVATSGSGEDSLWVRQLDALSVSELAGTEGGLFPFWSPDSRFVGFFAHGKLTVADLTGGPTRVVCDSPGFYGGSWNDDGVILFAPTHREIFRVPASGGAPSQVTTVDAAAHEIQHMWPEFLPDGRRFLYLSNSGPGGQRSVRLGSLDTKDTRLVLQNASHAAFAPPDRLMFVRDETLVAQRFDPVAARLSGEPVTIAKDVGLRQPIGRAAFSVSRNGVLVYRTADHILSQPTVFDRTGRRMIAFEPPADHDQPRFSPDERTAAVGMANPRGTPGRMIWLLNLASDRGSRLNLGSTGSGPIWSPDGKWLAFTGRREGPGDLYRRRATNDGQDEALLRSPDWKIVTDWSTDGQTLIYQRQDLATQWDIWALPLSGDRQPASILRGPSNEQHGRLSPDGRWMAYASDESGRFEVYVRPFPHSAAHWKISAEGGMQPEWRRDGRELFYVIGNGQLVAVPLQRGEQLQIGSTQPLFPLDTDGVMTTPGTFHYSATADGQRFLVNSVVNRGTPTMTIVLNWTTALEER